MASQKLPTINYNVTGVGSMGRFDTSLPARQQAAETNLIRSGIGLVGTTVDLIKKINKSSATNDLAVVESSLTEKMSELNTTIAKTNTYDAVELEDMGVKFEKQTVGLDENGNNITFDREIIPAHEVADQVYKIQARRIQGAAYSNAPNSKSLNAVKRKYAELYGKGINGALNHQLTHAQRAEKIKMHTAYESAVKAGNEAGAREIANVAFQSGTWSEDKYRGAISSLSDRVRTNIYMRSISNTDDAMGLEFSKTIMLNDNQISIAAKKSLNGMYSSKIGKIDAAAEKAAQERKVNSSANFLINSVDHIRAIGSPIPVDEIINMSQGMTPTDRKTLATYNNNMHGTTDTATFDALSVQVRSISIPDGRTTISQRREKVMADLTQAVEEKKLGGNDFLQLTGLINKSQEFQTSNPRAKRAVDMIWQDLTGGSKDMITEALSLGGVQTLTASKAEFDLKALIDTSPVGFDPVEWWNTNRSNYYSSSIIGNMEELEKQSGFGFIVMEEGSRYKINSKATIESMKAKVRSGSISQKDANAKLNQALGSSSQVERIINKDKKIREQFSQ